MLTGFASSTERTTGIGVYIGGGTRFEGSSGLAIQSNEPFSHCEPGLIIVIPGIMFLQSCGA